MKKDSKFNISWTLGLKISKSPSLNSTQWTLSNNTNSMPKFPYIFKFKFKWIFNEKYSIFNNFSILFQNINETKVDAPTFIKGFPTIPRMWL
jgi:hypothetical protein